MNWLYKNQDRGSRLLDMEMMTAWWRCQSWTHPVIAMMRMKNPGRHGAGWRSVGAQAGRGVVRTMTTTPMMLRAMEDPTASKWRRTSWFMGNTLKIIFLRMQKRLRNGVALCLLLWDNTVVNISLLTDGVDGRISYPMGNSRRCSRRRMSKIFLGLW